LIQKPGVFHIPPGMRDKVHVVDMPVLPLRRVVDREDPLELEDLMRLIGEKRDLRGDFIKRLTDAERDLVRIITAHPGATMKEWGRLLVKSPRTVENQFQSVIDKLVGFMDLDAERVNKRQLLLDILLGRLD
jgi:hypothetical protein